MGGFQKTYRLQIELLTESLQNPFRILVEFHEDHAMEYGPWPAHLGHGQIIWAMAGLPSRISNGSPRVPKNAKNAKKHMFYKQKM